MIKPFIVFFTISLTGCGSSPLPRSDSAAVMSAQVQSRESQMTPVDSVIQFLLTSAASDFHAHGHSHLLRFRDVSLVHFMSARGEMTYMLCGQFQSAQEGTDAAWRPFVTIKTSGYEQWVGAQATSFCQDASARRETVGDLTALLQSRFDSLK